MTRYFELFFDDDDSKWHLRLPWLRGGQKVDVWSYVQCRAGQREPSPTLEISHGGYRAEFNFAGAECVPVASPRIADILQSVAPGDFERIPVMVEDGTPMEIINVLRKVDCLDHSKSVGEYYPTSYREVPGIEPRAGRVQSITRLVIDPGRVQEANLFRISDWRIPVVASEKVVEALRNANLPGIVYQSILTDAPPGRMRIRRAKDWIVWPVEERKAWLASRNRSE